MAFGTQKHKQSWQHWCEVNETQSGGTTPKMPKWRLKQGKRERRERKKKKHHVNIQLTFSIKLRSCYFVIEFKWSDTSFWKRFEFFHVARLCDHSSSSVNIGILILFIIKFVSHWPILKVHDVRDFPMSLTFFFLTLAHIVMWHIEIPIVMPYVDFSWI